mmetsp:Transcript_37347/g.106869  ORF Transcript_37347/g.106869 Transcript_37347/m.106869 type:complete len:202 (+) Transcript_37347:971-1576(+)
MLWSRRPMDGWFGASEDAMTMGATQAGHWTGSWKIDSSAAPSGPPDPSGFHFREPAISISSTWIKTNWSWRGQPTRDTMSTLESATDLATGWRFLKLSSAGLVVKLRIRRCQSKRAWHTGRESSMCIQPGQRMGSGWSMLVRRRRELILRVSISEGWGERRIIYLVISYLSSCARVWLRSNGCVPPGVASTQCIFLSLLLN